MEHGRPSRTTGGPPDRAPAQGSRGWRRAVAWWPTLTAEQGRQFEAERRGREQSRARRNVLIFAGLWALFAVPDVTTITDLVPLALFLRLGVVAPLIVASYPVRLLGHRRGWPLLEELPQAFVGLAVQGMTTLLLVMTRSPHAVPYALTPLPVMIGYGMILRVRPPLAVATLASICGLGVIGVLHAPIVTQEWASGTVQITVLTLVLLLVIIGRREVDLRRTFLLRSQLTNLLDARDGDLQALAEANSRLAELTELDELTRLPNRRALQARLDQWDTQDRWGVIAMVDVDRFKLFNDVHGHATGDECLRLVAQAMQ